MFATTIPRDILRGMGRAERAAVDSKLSELVEANLLIRQDRIDIPYIQGVRYHTPDLEIKKILDAIAVKGYTGFTKNLNLINSLIEEGLIQDA